MHGRRRNREKRFKLKKKPNRKESGQKNLEKGPNDWLKNLTETTKIEMQWYEITQVKSQNLPPPRSLSCLEGLIFLPHIPTQTRKYLSTALNLMFCTSLNCDVEKLHVWLVEIIQLSTLLTKVEQNAKCSTLVKFLQPFKWCDIIYIAKIIFTNYCLTQVPVSSVQNKC